MEQKSKKTSLLISIITTISEKTINKIMKDQQTMCIMACVVYDYDSILGTATLYLPPDFTTISSVTYKNRTGVTIHPGEKVYLVYKYGDVSQGWIANV